MNLFGFEILEIAGLTGVAFYLGSYAALQIGLIRGNGYLYPILNGVAASLVLAGLMKDFNLSSAIIQGSWIVISIIGITRLFYIRNSIRFTADENIKRLGKLYRVFGNAHHYQ